MKSEADVAQNKGGSRPWGETQQLLEHKYGREKAGTINTYAVIKSGMKNVDDNGNSAPIPSQKAHRRLEEYKARGGLDDKSQELDGKALYSMEGDLRHGRVPIANGAVDKADVLAAAKSKNAQPTSAAAYRGAVEENDQLRESNEQMKESNEQLMESNEQLKETNEILIEENGVNRELILGTGSSHLGSHGDINDESGDERSDDMYGDGPCDDLFGEEGCNDMDEDNGGGNEDMED